MFTTIVIVDIVTWFEGRLPSTTEKWFVYGYLQRVGSRIDSLVTMAIIFWTGIALIALYRFTKKRAKARHESQPEAAAHAPDVPPEAEEQRRYR